MKELILSQLDICHCLYKWFTQPFQNRKSSGTIIFIIKSNPFSMQLMIFTKKHPELRFGGNPPRNALFGAQDPSKA